MKQKSQVEDVVFFFSLGFCRSSFFVSFFDVSNKKAERKFKLGFFLSGITSICSFYMMINFEVYKLGPSYDMYVPCTQNKCFNLYPPPLL